MPVLVRITIISAVNPSLAKNPSRAANCRGHDAKPGEDGAKRSFS
jgi:hypothetical protein